MSEPADLARLADQYYEDRLAVLGNDTFGDDLDGGSFSASDFEGDLGSEDTHNRYLNLFS